MRLTGTNGVLLFAGCLLAVTTAIALSITAPVTAPPAARADHPSAETIAEVAPSGGGPRQVDRAPATVEGKPAPVPVQSAVEPGPEHPDRIEGRVLRADGTPPPAGVTVIARRRGRVRIDPELVDRVLGGDPSIRVARSAADGGFVLAGLEPGAEYLLCAAGHGFVGRTTDLQARPGARDIVLVLSRLYGVVVRLREVGGGQLRTEADLAPPPLRTFGRAEPFKALSLLEFLGADLETSRAGPGDKLFFYTTNADPPAIPEVGLRFHPAGYEPIELTLDVPPVLPAIEVRTLEFEARAAGWGEIVVRFVGGSDPTLDGPLLDPFRLELATPEGRLARFELPRAAGEKRVRGVPFGRYEASLRNAIRQVVHPGAGDPPSIVEVGSDPVEIRVPLAGKAELEVVIEAGEEGSYSGPAYLRLSAGHPRPDLARPHPTGGLVLFDRGPYVLGALLPGPYTLHLQDPAGAVDGSELDFTPLDLEPASRTRVSLSIPGP